MCDVQVNAFNPSKYWREKKFITFRNILTLTFAARVVIVTHCQILFTLTSTQHCIELLKIIKIFQIPSRRHFWFTKDTQ